MLTSVDSLFLSLTLLLEVKERFALQLLRRVDRRLRLHRRPYNTNLTQPQICMCHNYQACFIRGDSDTAEVLRRCQMWILSIWLSISVSSSSPTRYVVYKCLGTAPERWSAFWSVNTQVSLCTKLILIRRLAALERAGRMTDSASFSDEKRRCFFKDGR